MRPMVMFRWDVYVSLGVLAVVATAAAVYTTRAVLIRVLIALGARCFWVSPGGWVQEPGGLAGA